MFSLPYFSMVSGGEIGLVIKSHKGKSEQVYFSSIFFKEYLYRTKKNKL